MHKVKEYKNVCLLNVVYNKSKVQTQILKTKVSNLSTITVILQLFAAFAKNSSNSKCF